jgi:GntR family transcriptional regulator
MRQSTDRPKAALIRVDLRSKTPAYLQIVEGVRALVAGGVLQAGDRLPTIRQMALEAHINFNTVARAYRVLDLAGVISTQHGRGTYAVAPPPSARARKARRQALDLLARDTLEAAARLGGGPEDLQAAIGRAAGRPARSVGRPRRR